MFQDYSSLLWVYNFIALNIRGRPKLFVSHLKNNNKYAGYCLENLGIILEKSWNFGKVKVGNLKFSLSHSHC